MARRNKKSYAAAKIVKPNTLQTLLFALGNPLYQLVNLIVEFISEFDNVLTEGTSEMRTLLLADKFYPLRKKPRRKTQKVLKKKKVKKASKEPLAFKFIEHFISTIKLELVRLRLLAVRLFKTGKPAEDKKRVRIAFLIVSISLFGLLVFWDQILRGLPKPESLATRHIDISTKIYDRNGKLLFKIYKDKNRSLIKLSELPNSLILATLAAEDAEFYDHFGFSVRGIVRALTKNIANGTTEGGSTITQQLVKNALLTPEKSLRRKLKELVLATLVETKFTKEQILEMYLNEVSYGGTAYGIEEASQIYLGKSARELTLAESAMLAGIPKSPTKHSPFGSNINAVMERQTEVLHLMEINKFITHEQRVEALDQEIVIIPNRIEIAAPHFVMYTREQLEDAYGVESATTGGFEVTTTLDLEIQQMAEEVLADEIARLKNLNVTNGGALVINPQNGQILAMVGSVDYFDQENDGNVNTLLSLRSPGSAIKIVTYALALTSGFSPASILDDTPITFRLPNSDSYSPKNYDGTFVGKLSLRNAFAQSRNVPAVKLVANLSVNSLVELGTKLGITSWSDPSNYGLSITLGGANVKLIDLAQAYATVANYGKKTALTPFIKIADPSGDRLMPPTCKDTTRGVLGGFSNLTDCTQEVLDEQVTFLLTNMLADNTSRSRAFGSNSQLVIPNHPEVAVKTGTSNDLRDNVTVGYNQDYLVAVWVGNNDNSPMSRIASGLTGASSIWNRIMRSLLADKESTPWQVPTGVEQVTICSLTGSLPCNNCPSRQEYFLADNVPTSHCDSKSFETTIINPDQILEGQSTQR